MAKIDDWAFSFAIPALSGVFATLLTHPLDTIVVHKVNKSPLTFTPSVLYRGLFPACGQALLIYGSMLGTYTVARDDFNLSVASAAAVSALPESLIKGPLEAIKNRSQVGKAWPRAWRARCELLLKGTLAMMCREVPGNMLYFGSYEYLRSNSVPPLIAGAAAGGAFCFVLPLEAVRVQIVSGRPFKDVEPNVNGFIPYVFRAVVVTSILFATFEAISDQFDTDGAGRSHSLGQRTKDEAFVDKPL